VMVEAGTGHQVRCHLFPQPGNNGSGSK